MEERLQNKIKNVLTLAYSPDKIQVSATVVIDYDKITENLEYEPQENGEVVDHYRESRAGADWGRGAGEEIKYGGHTWLLRRRTGLAMPQGPGIITGMWIP